MPVFDVTSPDGRTIEVTAPEGATEQQAIEYAQAHWDTISKGGEVKHAPSVWERVSDVARGTIETPLAVVSGIGGAALGGIAQAGASAYEAGKEMLGGDRTPGVAQAVGQDVASKFTYQPKSESGKASTAAVGNVLSGFGLLPKMAETARDTERKLTGGRTIATDIALGLLSALPVLRGKGIGEDAAAKNLEVKQKFADEVTASRKKLYGQDVADAGYFMDKGFKIVPHEIKAGEKSTVAGLVEGVSGEKRTADAISMHNQEIANGVAREDIGLSKDERITPDAIANKRLEAFAPYEAIKGYGADHNLKFKFDPQLHKELDGITNKITGSALAEERPTAESVMRTKRAVDAVKSEIYGEGDAAGKLSPSATIDLIHSLREESADIYKKTDISTDDKKIAQVKYDAANALENMLDRRLSESGETSMLTDFRNARKKLSQLHVYSEILNPETGNVAIRKLAGKRYEDKPFTEGLADLRKFALKYKESSKPEVQQRPHGISPIEAGLTALDIAKHPVRSAIVGSRVLARPALTSGPMQRAAIPKMEEKPSKTSRALDVAASAKTQAAVSSAEQERARRKKERSKQP